MQRGRGAAISTIYKTVKAKFKGLVVLTKDKTTSPVLIIKHPLDEINSSRNRGNDIPPVN